MEKIKAKDEIRMLKAEINLSDDIILRESREEIEERVKYILSGEIAEYIIKNLDELKLNIEKEDKLSIHGGATYTLKMNLVSDELSNTIKDFEFRKKAPEKRKVLKQYPAHEAIRLLFPGRKNYYKLNKLETAVCVHVGKLISVDYSPFMERMPTERTTIPLRQIHSAPTYQDIFVGICPDCNNLYYYIDGETITLIQEE